MSEFMIVLPTHSSYIGVVENFLQLLRKNWPDCPFKILVSVTGDPVKLAEAETIYNGKDASLIDCLVNVANKYESKYYISFLGDAFINKSINNADIIKILDTLTENHIEYCSLQCVKNYKKVKSFDDCLRHINNLDRYSHNFTAFAASRKYITEEMSTFETDLEFEKNYLYQKNNYYYDNHLIVKKNYFNLLPSIAKGKWDRFNLAKLKKNNPEIEFEDRELQSKKDAILCHVRGGGSPLYTVVPAGWIEGVRRESFSDKIWSDRIGVRYGE